MGTTGNFGLPQAKTEAMQILLTPAPEERETYIEESVKNWKVFWGTLPYDEEEIRIRSARSYDRSRYPQGMARQLMAVWAHGNRKPHLNSIKAPTLVIHGAEDPLVPVEGGKDTADTIPGAEILIIDGMGHCLPRAVWSQVIEAIAKHTSKANLK